MLVHYTADPAVPKEIERNLGITEGVLRYLTTRVEEKKSSVKPRAPRPAPAPIPTPGDEPQQAPATEQA